jgi:hypothetical protein
MTLGHDIPQSESALMAVSLGRFNPGLACPSYEASRPPVGSPSSSSGRADPLMLIGQAAGEAKKR